MSSQRISNNAQTQQSSGDAAMTENPQVQASGQSTQMLTADQGRYSGTKPGNGLPHSVMPTGHKAAAMQDAVTNDASAGPRENPVIEQPCGGIGGQQISTGASPSHPRMPLTIEE